MSDLQSCMNCANRTENNECAIKKCFAMNYNINGLKYKRSIGISYDKENTCEYHKKIEQQEIDR